MVVVPALALVAACSRQPPPAPAAPTVHDIMKNKVDANADALWNLTNPALDNHANIVASRVDDATWSKIVRRAQAVADGAGELADLKPLQLIEPGEKIADQDQIGGNQPDEVQHNLDQHPDDFREFAGALQAHMNDVVAGARAHDANKLTPLIDQLDGVCENCHLEFWYPNQKAYIESIRKNGGNDPTS